MKQTGIEEFVALSRVYPVFDVRSPGEYRHAHIPGAYSLPLFSDDERKVVGTLYKQLGREDAIKTGLDYFGGRMRKMVEEVEGILKSISTQNKYTASTENKEHSKTVLVHCWRGGMRSAGVAWLLDLYGFKVYVLTGGYKAYRTWVLEQFAKPYPIKIVGGFTGSGKTDILKLMAKEQHAIIDLEGIAHHKGSAFGALGETDAPGQEQFENVLAVELHKVSAALLPEQSIWIEDESRRIGLVNQPDRLWETMRNAPLYFLDIPFEERLDYITAEYGVFKREELVNSVLRIQKRLGGMNTKNAIGYLIEGNTKECFRILLAYYDKFYKKDLDERKAKNVPINIIDCDGVDASSNYKKLQN